MPKTIRAHIINCIRAAHERAVHRLIVARRELTRFKSHVAWVRSRSDVAMLKRLRRNVAIALSNVAWVERALRGAA
jgi:hypothetical protein